MTCLFVLLVVTLNQASLSFFLLVFDHSEVHVGTGNDELLVTCRGERNLSVQHPIAIIGNQRSRTQTGSRSGVLASFLSLFKFRSFSTGTSEGSELRGITDANTLRGDDTN